MAKRDRDTGSALVSSIALSAVFAGLAVLSIQVALSDAFLTREFRQDVMVDAQLRTAFAEALWELQRADARPAYNQVFELEAGGAVFQAEYFSPSGQVDINAASPSVLAPLLSAAGSPDAGAVAAAIADWRDPDDLTALQGSEAQAYRALDMAEPANAPFQNERELGQVMGMPAGVLACLRNELTVSTRDAAPDLSLSSDWLRAVFALGESGASQTRTLPVTVGSGDLVGLRLVRLEPASPYLEASILVRFTGSRAEPFWIQAWDVYHAAAPACEGAA